MEGDNMLINREKWVPDDSQSWCVCCGALFSLIRRRHHCRTCGRLVCGPCSKYKHIIDNKSYRICINCNCVLIQRRRGLVAYFPKIDEYDMLIKSTMIANIHDHFVRLQTSSGDYEDMNNIKKGYMCCGIAPIEVASMPTTPINKNKTNNNNKKILNSWSANNTTPSYRIWYISPDGWLIVTSVLQKIPHDLLVGHACIEHIYHVGDINNVESVWSSLKQDDDFIQGIEGIKVSLNDDNIIILYPPTNSKQKLYLNNKQLVYYDTLSMNLLHKKSNDIKHIIETHCSEYEVLKIRESEKLKTILDERFIKVDWNIEEHVELLKRVWQAFRPDDKFPGIRSHHWKGVGFQGDDPSTDFRGMGLLALRSIVYWGEKYSNDVSRALASQPEDVIHQYPVCVAVINCVNLIVKILTTSDTKDELFGIMLRGYHPLMIHELIRCLITSIDRLWWHHNAEYFDFNKIMAQVQDRLMACIQHNPVSFEVLCAWMLDADWF